MAAIPTDGRITSLTTLAGTLTGGELMYIVSPGNVASGVSYNITTLTLAQFIVSGFSPTIITASYPSVATDTRILIELSPVTSITITMLASSSYIQPILIKDVAGTVSAAATATIVFSSGQESDGQTSIILNNAYAGIWLNPLPSGGFYLTNA